MRKVNLTEAFATFDDCWSPKIAGEINDAYVKLVKLQGAFDWHHHETEDELFLVIAGGCAWACVTAPSISVPESSS